MFDFEFVNLCQNLKSLPLKTFLKYFTDTFEIPKIVSTSYYYVIEWF